MQRLEVSGAVRPLHGSLGVKGLTCQFPRKIIPNGSVSHRKLHTVPHTNIPLRKEMRKQTYSNPTAPLNNKNEKRYRLSPII
jgi:hypothetical protein